MTNMCHYFVIIGKRVFISVYAFGVFNDNLMTI